MNSFGRPDRLDYGSIANALADDDDDASELRFSAVHGDRASTVIASSEYGNVLADKNGVSPSGGAVIYADTKKVAKTPTIQYSMLPDKAEDELVVEALTSSEDEPEEFSYTEDSS